MPYSRLFYHVIWATKERKPMINDTNRNAIYACIVHKVAEFGGFVHALNGTVDHVHLVVSVPPSVPLSKLIGQVKGSSSHLAARLTGSITHQEFGWQDEYGVLTVSEQHLPIVIQYVVRQQEHHQACNLNATLENMA